MKTWFITGASRGFGLEIVRQALERGDNVAATARDADAVLKALPVATGQLLPLALDVTDEAQSHAATAAALKEFGTIDVLVNNAGRDLLGPWRSPRTTPCVRCTTPTSSACSRSPVPYCR